MLADASPKWVKKSDALSMIVVMLAADRISETSGRRIGRWELERSLGAGSLGSVYVGCDQDGTRAAIKTIRPDLAASPVLRRRLARELEVIRKVPQGGTAVLVDADPAGDPPFVATELIEGPTLREQVEDGGCLPEPTVSVLAGRLASTLARIHAAGIVHRDVKPANLVLGAHGPVLIDFGIASLAEYDDSTKLDQSEGSPGWLAPEQVVGEGVGAPADVFAWGSVVTYAAAGVGPFGRGRSEAMAFRVLHQDPFLDDLPLSLRRLVAASLEKCPDNRPTARDLIDALVTRPAAA